MDYTYMIMPLIAWFSAGAIKFAVNCVRSKRIAFDLIGYGGFPSNHSAIVCSSATLIALREGVASPVFGVAVTLAFIVMLDANSLRREIGRHAVEINKLSSEVSTYQKLRERIGHDRVEIFAGMVLGVILAATVYACFT